MRPLAKLLIVRNPCGESWDAMVGDERVRHCDACGKDVHRVSTFTRAEAEALMRRADRPCLLTEVRDDGAVLLADGHAFPGPSRARRAAVVVGATMLAACTEPTLVTALPETAVVVTPVESLETTSATVVDVPDAAPACTAPTSGKASTSTRGYHRTMGF